MQPLGQFLIAAQQKNPDNPGEFSHLIHAFRQTFKALSHEVKRMGIRDVLDEVKAMNTSADVLNKPNLTWPK